jgi:hypothetical protein
MKLVTSVNQTRIFYIATKPKTGEGLHWKPTNLEPENFKRIELIQLGQVGDTESDMDNLDMMKGIMNDDTFAVLLGIYKGSKNKIII